MNAIIVLNLVVLWVHLLSAVVFIGGSYFMWFVVVPASRLMTQDESERTQIVGKIAKEFGRIVNPTLVILILTGIYNASWYVSSVSSLVSYPGTILLTKMILVAVLIFLVYLNNAYFGKQIVRLGKERRLEELRQLRKMSRLVSIANLSLMTMILLLAAMMQITP
ncbi:MAG TPA: CopD family protein [Candidatus Bathyarchaeia archaeon]|nr:CopD family protein [Candidatus Bathyarchaeia archaeon]